MDHKFTFLKEVHSSGLRLTDTEYTGEDDVRTVYKCEVCDTYAYTSQLATGKYRSISGHPYGPVQQSLLKRVWIWWKNTEGWIWNADGPAWGGSKWSGPVPKTCEEVIVSEVMES